MHNGWSIIFSLIRCPCFGKIMKNRDVKWKLDTPMIICIYDKNKIMPKVFDRACRHSAIGQKHDYLHPRVLQCR